MDNEFTQRLQREGIKGVARYLQAILKKLEAIQEQLADIKKKKEPVITGTPVKEEKE